MPPRPPLVYDPSVPGFSGHAHAVYDRLRDEEPFHWAPQVQEWIVTRHADVKAVLRHPALRPPDVAASIDRVARETALPLPALRLLIAESVMLQSAPGHAQARRFLSRVMNQRPLAESAPMIESIVAGRVDALRKAGGGDLVADFARAVPLQFMGAWLGVPAEEMALLADCAEDVIFVLERRVNADQWVEINSRVALAIDHLAGSCAERRAVARDDGLSRIMDLARTEPDLDDRLVATRVFFLFIAGLDTTTTFLGRAMLDLLMNDGERMRWQEGAVDGAIAVEELLRHTSPVARVTREAAEDGEVCGRLITRGQRISAMIEAANRDPAVFADPHRLDLDRAPCPHLSFGDGVHACLGAGLARMKAGIALREFVRLPRLRQDEPPQASRADILKPFKTLPVVFT